jgi:hypothetical protein
MSFGLRPPASLEEKDKFLEIRGDIEDAIDKAGHRIIFAAASNSGKNQPRAFPATCRKVICVHASDGKGEDGGINPEPEPDENFMTLGIAVELLEKGKSVYKSGTSFATPIAAGIAANVLAIAARRTELSNRVKQELKKCDGMRTMFRLMSPHKSIPKYRFVAPWLHWSESWRVKNGSVWLDIENELNGLN